MDRINSAFTNNNVSRQLFIDNIYYANQTSKSDNYPFVTELTGNHLTGRHLKQDVIEILYEMECTDIVTELNILKEAMKEHLRKRQSELRAMRERSFMIHSEGTDDVYATFADNKKNNDRDIYIKELVDYYEIMTSLQKIAQTKAKESESLEDKRHQSFAEIQYNALIFLGDSFSEDSVRLCPLSHSFGDLSAVHHLMHNIPAKVPDFTFNPVSTLTK